jgi:predicted Rdx family selenoprotein
VAAELRSALGVEVVLVKGSGGVFDVVADGVVVFSKSRVGRFPEAGEVAVLLERHMTQGGSGAAGRQGRS